MLRAGPSAALWRGVEMTKGTDERLTHPNSDEPALAGGLAREQPILPIERSTPRAS